MLVFSSYKTSKEKQICVQKFHHKTKQTPGFFLVPGPWEVDLPPIPFLLLDAGPLDNDGFEPPPFVFVDLDLDFDLLLRPIPQPPRVVFCTTNNPQPNGEKDINSWPIVLQIIKHWFYWIWSIWSTKQQKTLFETFSVLFSKHLQGLSTKPTI